MSLGYCGMCVKVMEDDEAVVYSYAGENWNDGGKSQSRDSLLQDGVIFIYKRCLEEPEIHSKIKRTASGRKKMIIKRITYVPSICDHVRNGDIIVEKECKNAFRHFRFKSIPLDYIAYRLLGCIFTRYQEDGILPEREYFIQ